MLGHPIELGKPWNYVSLCHNAAAVLLPIYRASSYAKLLTELANRANSLRWRGVRVVIGRIPWMRGQVRQIFHC
jgi:hypothetical protein